MPRRKLIASAVLAATIGFISAQAVAHSDYIYVWSGDADKKPGDKDFLATVGVKEGTPEFGRVIETTPVTEVGTMPHHIEPTVSSTDDLFASGFMANKIYRFDMSNPAKPMLTHTIHEIPGWKMSHSFIRTPKNEIIATMQYKAGDKAASGGLAVLGAGGDIVKTLSVADPKHDGPPIRSYGVDIAPKVDRAVVTSTPMAMETASSDVVQIYRMSDMALLHTLPLKAPKSDPSRVHHPFEIRTLADGQSMMLNTFQCGFYLVDGLETKAPNVELVYALSKPTQRACSVPVVAGNYWVMPVQKSDEVVVLDISDPRNVKEVFTLATDKGFSPHYAALEPGNNRIALTGFMGKDFRVMMMRIDMETGALSWDENFRDPNTGNLGVDFKRSSWPHGDTGPAMPHGIVWSKKI